MLRSRPGSLRNRPQHTEYGDGYVSEPVWTLGDEENLLLLQGFEL